MAKIHKDCRQEYMSAAQVAKLVGCSPGKIIRACKTGELEYMPQAMVDFDETMRFGRRPKFLIKRSEAYEYRAKIVGWRKRIKRRKERTS